MRNNNKVYNKMYIDIITPTNIASNIKLNPVDYIYEPKKKIAYFFNPILWHKFIYQNNLLESYEKFLAKLCQKPPSRLTLYDWLQQSGYSLKDIEHTIKYKLYANVNINNPKTLNNIVLHTKLATGNAYIPGSSLKGVIRTAILFDLLKDNSRLKNRYWSEITSNQNFNRNTKDRLDRIVKNMESNLLKILQVSNSQTDNLDIMQGIQISDSVNLEDKVELVLLKKHDISMISPTNIKESDISLYRECIVPNTRFLFDMQIDTSFTKEIGIKSVDDILVKLENYFESVNELLKTAFGTKYQKLFADTVLGNAYLGGGTGFLSKTLIAMLAPSPKEARVFISNWLNLNFRNRTKYRDSKISPRTLKTVEYAQQTRLQGIVKIGKVDKK